MPWSNQGGGGGGWKGGGPWGQPPGGGGGQQPDLEEILKRSQDRLKQAMPGGGMNKGFLFLGGLAGLLALSYFMFTVTVQPDELGIVTRFGKFDRQLPPGLNWRMPYPVEEVYLPSVTKVNSVEIGGGSDSRSLGESLMVTGDENIVDVDFIVFWRIKDAPSFLFNVKDGFQVLQGDPAQTVRDVAESAMREIVGKSDIQPILTQDRAKTEAAVHELMQRTLDLYRAGIEITQVQLQKVDPPAEVIDAFRDVQAAKADKDRAQNEADAYSNKVIPEARGDAQRIIQDAQAYKEKNIAEAKGQADRFTKVYETYKQAPEVTRRRMFLETMERVMGNMDKIIVDQPGKGTGVVPFLPLNELTKKSQQGQGAQ